MAKTKKVSESNISLIQMIAKDCGCDDYISSKEAAEIYRFIEERSSDEYFVSDVKEYFHNK